MNGFLLLRDNKQTGPYTISELKQMGLKSYDLIWQEGKSAAWRYPGEIPDLKDFAPPVLEQPFDRFFKKPGEIKSTEEMPAENKPQTASPVQSLKKSSKVFVEMPESGVVHGSNEKAISIPKEKVELPSATTSKPAEYIKVNIPASDDFQQNNPQVARKSGISDRTYDYLMRGIFAICLILIGFIVAIYIYDLRSGSGVPPQDQQVIDELPAGMEASLLPLDNEEEPDENLNPPPVQTNYNKKPSPQKQPVVKNVAIPPKEEEKQPEEIIPAPLSAEELALLKKEIMGKITLETNADYKVSPFGGVDNLKVVLSNNSNNALNKVDVKVNFYNPNRKTVKSQILNLRNVGAGEVKEIEVPKSSRGVEFSVELVAVDPVQ